MKKPVRSSTIVGVVIFGVLNVTLREVLRTRLGALEADIVAGVLAGIFGALIYGILQWMKKNKGKYEPDNIPKPKASVSETINAREHVHETAQIKEVPKAYSYSKIGGVIYFLQVLLVLVAALPLGLLFLFEHWFFTDAYSALEVLRAYFRFHQAGLVAIALWLLLAIIGNVALLLVARRQKISIGGYLIVAIATVFTIGIISSVGLVFHEEDGMWNEMQKIQMDISAIEENRLETEHILLSFPSDANERPTQSWYRTASLSDMGEYRPLYLASFRHIGRTYFAPNTSPAHLREMTRDARYQIPNAAEYMRRFVITYTPNFQIIVSAVPVRG